MKKFTMPKIWDLAGPSGKTATPTFSASTTTTTTFNMNNMPNGKGQDSWYYVTGIVLDVVYTIVQAGGAGSAMNKDQIYKQLQSVRVWSPTLGDLYSHNNTKGSVLGSVIMPYAAGYVLEPTQAPVAAANATYTFRVSYRLPFSFEFLVNPHDTSPWAGFFEAGIVEAKFDLTTLLATDSTGCTCTGATINCWAEMIPQKQLLIHSPFNFRLHNNLPGSTPRSTITDIGAPDQLSGIDTNRGAGIASLLYLTTATNIGLGGAGAANNILQVEIPWRDQTVTDNPEAFLKAFFQMMGPRAVPPTLTDNFQGYPYRLGATASTTGQNNSADLLFFPLIFPGSELKLSKLQTVLGAKDINFRYTSTPSASPAFLGHYFYTFSADYLKKILLPRIAPGQNVSVRAKTSGKQRGFIPLAGKTANLPLKVVPAK